MSKYKVVENWPKPVVKTRNGKIIDFGKFKIGVCRTPKYDSVYYKKYTATCLETGYAYGKGEDNFDDCVWLALFLRYSPEYKYLKSKAVKELNKKGIKTPLN